MNINKKYYTIVDFPEDNQTFGNFSGSIPKKAANKAFSSLLKFLNDDIHNDFTGNFIVFVIKDTTTNKLYKYIGTRIKLKNPINKIINDKTITYHYKNVIGKYKPELDLM
jgi:hypothetical protein